MIPAGGGPGDTIVPFEELLLLPGALCLATWTAATPIAQLPAPIQDRLATLLDELEHLYGAPSRELIDAVLAGDGRAWSALVQIHTVLGQALDQLMPRIRQAKLAGDWLRLRHDSRLAIQLADATGRDPDLALAALLQANAHTALGDLAGSVQPFRRSIAAATAAGDLRLQSVGHGNLGNALRDGGDCDAALIEYAAALDIESDPRGRALVLFNRAVALQRLGDRASALQSLLDQAAALGAAAAPAVERVAALGHAVNAALDCGDTDRALELLDQAGALVDASDLPGRAMLAGLRARAASDRGDGTMADAAQNRAWELALDHAVSQLQPHAAHYAQGFAAALAHRLPTERAFALLGAGVSAKDANRWQTALQALQAAEQQARQEGDRALALRLAANLGALMADAGQLVLAQRQLQSVQAEAAEHGLARPEAMAWGTMAALAAQTGELVLGQDVIVLQAMAAALMDMHIQLLAASKLPAQDAPFEFPQAELGALLNERALLAHQRGAWAQAADLFEQAAELIRPCGPTFQLANRLAGLTEARARLSDTTRADAAARELSEMRAKLQPRGKLIATRALAQHWNNRDPAQALKLWQEAADIAEQLRTGLPAGFDASEVNRGFSRLPQQCAQRLRRADRIADAWQRLQQGKARRVLDARATGGRLPTLAEIQAALQPDELLVDMAIEDDGLTAYRVWPDGIDAVFEPLAWPTLEPPALTDRREREQASLALARNHPGLAQWAAQVADGPARGRRLLLVPDGPLHNLPLHEIGIDRLPWHARQPLGLLPCAAWLLHALPTSSRAALVAGNSASDLPGAEAECRAAAAGLGVTPLTGDRCTRQAVEAALLSGALDVVHLALHGRGDTERGARASLLLADGLGGTEWVPFGALTQHAWHANLVVLSGCSTAMAGPLHGHEIVSVARAVLEAGAATVVASLWPVADQAAATLMSLFHAEVRRRRRDGVCDLRQALDSARRDFATKPTRGGPRRDGGSAASNAASAHRASVPDGTGPPGADAVAAFVLIGLPTLPRRTE